MNQLVRDPKPTKPFSWSYSALKNFETCERRHYEIDRAKRWKEDSSDALLWGNSFHEAMAARIGPKKKPLPITMAKYEEFALVAEKYGAAGEIHVENKIAFDRAFRATEYFDNSTWFRGVIDLIIRIGDLAIMWDWKTGKVLDDPQQLGLFATCVFSRYPEIQRCQTSYIWIGNDATSDALFTRADLPRIWADIMPRVKRMEEAYYSVSYSANPSGLCKKYCPVASCEYYGVGSR